MTGPSNNPSAPPEAAQPSPRSAVNSAALPAGHCVFEYRIDKTLGGGGFGLTYLAQDLNLELSVALKEYFPGDLARRMPDQSVQVHADDRRAQFNWGLERFLDEARALASFRHAHIARVLRYFKENGTAYIVMEYESGEPLKGWLSRQGVLSQSMLLGLIHPLLDGLAAVHKMNFLHRDIKPDNIYVRADGSPVLLDFGAARRLTANPEMSNIVSPGFTPFEQYHSQGNQGPWTDIYALGAVMYWIVTGRAPAEAASRVKQSSMPKAVDAGRAMFSQPLLRAIDWALCPDEASRPQNVAAFRDALVSAAQAAPGATQGSAPTGGARAKADSSAYVNSSQSFPHSHSDGTRRSMLGTLMFVGLVAFSKLSTAQQAAAKAQFDELVGKALKGVDETSRTIIATDAGAAVCFQGDPEEALQSALLLRGLLMQKYRHGLSIRIGLHLGPMRLVTGSNEQLKVVGDGINVAQRIMDFAQPNQIVVSRAYYDVVCCLGDLRSTMFNPLGPHLDKHLRSHDIYAVLDPSNRAASAPPSIEAFENTATFPVTVTLTPQIAADIEDELARAIGPLASVLVKKAVVRAINPQGLRELLAVSIPDAAVRQAFLTGGSPARCTGTPSQPGDLLIESGRRSSQYDSLPLSWRSAPASSGFQLSQPGHSQPASLWPTNSQAAPLPLRNLSPDRLMQLEHMLSRHIGPLARLVIQKQAQQHNAFASLIAALAYHIDAPDQRRTFIAAALELQPG